MTAAPTADELLAAAGITPQEASATAAPVPGTEIIPPTWEALLDRAGGLVAGILAAEDWHDCTAQLDALADSWGALLQQDPTAKRHLGELVACLSNHSKPGLTPTRTEVKDYLKAGADRVAAKVRAARAAVRAEVAAEAFTAQPFTIKGWDPERRLIYYQVVASGHIGKTPPPSGSGSSGLLPLAPLEWWEAVYGGGRTMDWDRAADFVVQAAEGLIFRPESRRGRGVWLDAGRVVWHLGDRLLADGERCGVGEIKTAHTYDLKPALPPLEHGPELNDQQGAAVLMAVEAIGWTDPLAPLLLAGWCVVANVGGAMTYRPAAQITAQHGKGKTTTVEVAVAPLLGGLVELKSNATEAFVRQCAGGDTLPVLLDESEQGDSNGRTRAGHVKLMRCSFDGRMGGRGTVGGQASEQQIRYSVLAVGINATVPEAADRSRIVTLTRRHLPHGEWAIAEQLVAGAITPAIGQALIRRTVCHLHTLQANAQTLAKAIERSGDSARSGDCYGTLLAGAHLLLSTARLTPEQASAWLAGIGWAGTAQQVGAEPLDEGVRCLETILAHTVRWAGDTPDMNITLRELAEMAIGHGDTAAAVTVLGRHGLRVLLGELSVSTGPPVGGRWLLVSNATPGLEQLLAATRWAKGGHRQHLESLPGALKPAGPKRFLADGQRRCTAIPWERAFPGGEVDP